MCIHNYIDTCMYKYLFLNMDWVTFSFYTKQQVRCGIGSIIIFFQIKDFKQIQCTDKILLHWIKLNTNTFSNTKNYNHFQLYKYMNIKIYVHLLRVKINVYSQLFVTFKCSKYFFIDTSVGHAFCFLASFIASNLAWGFPNAFMAPCSSSYNEFSLIKYMYLVNLRTPV